MTERSRATQALRTAQASVRSQDSVTLYDILPVAYMRLLVAYRTGGGVRLSADEVSALLTLDSAMMTAADHIEDGLLQSEDE